MRCPTKPKLFPFVIKFSSLKAASILSSVTSLSNMDLYFPAGTSIAILFSFCMLSATLATINISTEVEDCEFPAIFNFGDSNSDTGGFAAAFIQPNFPNGVTYFDMPAGRYCDGRLIVDFISKGLHLPHLSAYLNSLGTNFTHGANFATSSSTIFVPTSIIPYGDYSPFHLQIQYNQFMQFKARSQLIAKQGGVFSTLMPKEDYFRKALYTFDIGQNDLGAGFFGDMSLEQVNASVPAMIDTFSTYVKGMYDLGARSFWIHNTGPIGCLAYVLVGFPTAEKDNAGCARRYNEVAQYFNHKLKERVVELRKGFPAAAFTYVDVYSVKYGLFKEPKNYGFELPLIACCGYGNKYNYTSAGLCGDTVTVNGSQMILGACDRPSARVVWDGIHYTEAANKFIFEQISTGAFSDPPIPLNKACHSFDSPSFSF